MDNSKCLTVHGDVIVFCNDFDAKAVAELRALMNDPDRLVMNVR